MNKKYLTTTVFKKYIMAATGLALVGFVVVHLLGNLLLYKSDGNAFNEYAHRLHSLGPLLIVAEMGLLAFFLFHAFTGIRLAIHAYRARPTKYAVLKTKGGASKNGPASNNMAWSGTFLFLFVVLHIIHFKFGPDIAEGYSTVLGAASAGAAGTGEEVRDLQRHVVEQFKNPAMVILYTIAMIFLGFHLRHGIWSAFHSLGLTRENNSKAIYLIGGGLGLLLAAGFLCIPIYIFFRGA